MNLKVGDKIIAKGPTLSLGGEVIQIKTVDSNLYTIIKWSDGHIADYKNEQLKILGVEKDYQSIRQNKLNELGI